jgi:predicted nucleotidyltransferase
MVLTPNVREQLRAASTDSAPSHSGNIATLHAHEPELRHQSIHHAALFGSVVRGEARPSSDIDLLIDLNPEAPIGFFKYVELTGFIGGLFPVRVDIANRARLKPYVLPRRSARRSKFSDRTRQAHLNILGNTALVWSFVTGMEFGEFADDRRTFYAVTWCLEIISEASRRLDEALRARHLELPCRAIMAAAKSTGVNLTPWLGCLPLSGWNLTSIPTGMEQFSATAIVNDPVLSAVDGAADGSAPKAGLRRLNDEQLGLRR